MPKSEKPLPSDYSDGRRILNPFEKPLENTSVDPTFARLQRLNDLQHGLETRPEISDIPEGMKKAGMILVDAIDKDGNHFKQLTAPTFICRNVWSETLGVPQTAYNKITKIVEKGNGEYSIIQDNGASGTIVIVPGYNVNNGYFRYSENTLGSGHEESEKTFQRVFVSHETLAEDLSNTSRYISYLRNLNQADAYLLPIRDPLAFGTRAPRYSTRLEVRQDAAPGEYVLDYSILAERNATASENGKWGNPTYIVGFKDPQLELTSNPYNETPKEGTRYTTGGQEGLMVLRRKDGEPLFTDEKGPVQEMYIHSPYIKNTPNGQVKVIKPGINVEGKPHEFPVYDNPENVFYGQASGEPLFSYVIPGRDIGSTTRLSDVFKAAGIDATVTLAKEYHPNGKKSYHRWCKEPEKKQD